MLVQVFTKFTGRGRSCHVLGVGSMPSTVRWTYKGEEVEHHGEQRIELGDYVIDDEHPAP